jgi:co-chaperonin GroES (HSP10)
MASKMHKDLVLPSPTMGVAMGLGEIRPALPKIKSVSPFGSKILVEILRDDEIMGTSLIVGAGSGTGATQGGAPQALIVKLGDGLDESCGLKEGQRVYWTGKGTLVDDPSKTEGRNRALLEVSNILAVINEE